MLLSVEKLFWKTGENSFFNVIAAEKIEKIKISRKLFFILIFRSKCIKNLQTKRQFICILRKRISLNNISLENGE